MSDSKVYPIYPEIAANAWADERHTKQCIVNQSTTPIRSGVSRPSAWIG